MTPLMTETQVERFVKFCHEKTHWGYETFGHPKDRDHTGPLRHLLKEVDEVRCEQDRDRRDLEIADLLFLGLDAAQRAYDRSRPTGDQRENVDHFVTAAVVTYQYASMPVDERLQRVAQTATMVLEGRHRPFWPWGLLLVRDIVGLAVDDGMSIDHLIDTCRRKLEINRLRTWPKPADPNGIVEHVKVGGV